MTKPDKQESTSPSQLIDARIKELGDWRGETLSRLRTLIRQADPDVVEEWKWRGVPVWSHDGLICTGETYKSVVKITIELKQPAAADYPRFAAAVKSSRRLHARWVQAPRTRKAFDAYLAAM